MTHDHCTAALIFRIDKGQHGATDLAGLSFALMGQGREDSWPTATGFFTAVVDERADAAQRAALAGIVSGDAGGPSGMIRSNLDE